MRRARGVVAERERLAEATRLRHRIRDELRGEVRAEVAAELQKIIAAESAPAAREILGCIADRLLDS